MVEEEPFVRTWVRTVRRIRLGRTVKEVAIMLATYADPDGSRVHPGVARLSYECELSYTSVKSALRALRKYGLIVKVGKKGDADDYHLILHEDLLERVDVPTPSQADAEIHRIRMAWKGTYSPGLRSTRTPAETDEIDEEEDLRSTAPTAESPDVEESAVNGSTRKPESAVNGSNSLRSTAPTATYQEEPLTEKYHSGEDQSTDVAVSRASSHEPPISPPADLNSRPRCPHGRSTRRNDHGQLRCVDCRAAEEAEAVAVEQIEQAAATVEVGPSRCTDHGLPAHRCVFCRKGIPGAAS